MPASKLRRRDLLRRILGMRVCTRYAGRGILPLLTVFGEQGTQPAGHPVPESLSPEDDQLLEELESANFRYFWEQADPQTGLVKDRCNVRGPDSGVVASIAATGFGLTALCIGHKRGFISLPEVQ